jgi:hypothetical protein
MRELDRGPVTSCFPENQAPPTTPVATGFLVGSLSVTRTTTTLSLFQISFTASTGANTQGQFMIMQIIDASYSQYTDSSNQSWYLTNGPAFPGFNGPLHNDSATYNSIGYPFLYGGT